MTASKEIGVCSGSHQIEVILVDFVDQQPVRLNMRIPMVLPVPAEGMVSVSGWEGLLFDQQKD